MVQAARSCKQNIAEGSAASGTSKETEIKLTNVARATLDELIEDYKDRLKSHNAIIWPSQDIKAKAAREYARNHAEWKDWKTFFETRPPETLANLMLTLCYQTRFMLDKMIVRQEEDFKKFGGIRERMHVARTAVRAEDWDKSLYSRLDCSKNLEELEALSTEMHEEVSRAVWSIRQRRGWC